MERETPTHLSNNNQNNTTVHGNNAVVLNFNPASNVSVVQQQTEADSKIKRLFTLLNPLVSSTRVGSNVPREGCLAGTRRELLQDICAFVSDPNPPHVRLIMGLAGMGKSAIARSTTDTLAKSGFLVASYFISRSIPPSRKTERLVQTLAYQFAEQNGVICAALLATLDSNPGVLGHNIASQVRQLIVSPLRSARSVTAPRLTIIIDGLDESEDVGTLLSDVVEPIAEALFELHLKLVIFSREFGALRRARTRGALRGIASVRWLYEIDAAIVRSDMRMFIADGLGQLRVQANLDATWPTCAQVDVLTDRAGSLFIYAATVLKFLGDESYSPKTRLEWLLPSIQRLSRATDLDSSPFAQLDALYLEVLLTVVGTTPLFLRFDLVQRLQFVLAAVLYAGEPMSMRMLSGIFGIRLDDIEPIIRGLAAIWPVPDDRDKPLHVYHVSFSDFISDPARCTEPCLYLPSAVGHELLATACLRKMTVDLRRDMCQLIKPSVPLPCIEAYTLGVIEESVNSTLKYACFHGVDTHLTYVASKTSMAGILGEVLATFCDNHLLHWVEIRAVFGEESLTNLVRALHRWTKTRPIAEVETWMRASRLFAELHDMVYEFQEIILASPLEIYNVCLALLPSGSLVSTYENHTDVMVQRITPRPDTWFDARHLFSQTAITTCIVTEGNWTACGFVEHHENEPFGKNYVLLWPVILSVPFRLDVPHALQSLAFSASASHLVALSEQPFGSGGSSTSISFITVWDLATQRMVSLRQVVTKILGISFDANGSHVLCVTCRPEEPVLRLSLSLDGSIPRPPLSSGWYPSPFSADRRHAVFGQLRGPLFWAGEPSLWRPIVLPVSTHPFIPGTGTGPCDARILISSDGSVIVATFFGRPSGQTSGGFALRAWNMAYPELPRMLKVFTDNWLDDGSIIESPAISRDGRLLAFCAPHSPVGNGRFFTLGELRWENGPQFLQLARWPCAGGMIAEFSEDASLVAVFDELRVLRVWDIKTGHEVPHAVENVGCNVRLRFGAAYTVYESHRETLWIRPPAASSLHLSFLNAGVIGCWNSDGRSHAVLISSHDEPNRPLRLLFPSRSRFRHWHRGRQDKATLAGWPYNQGEFTALVTSEEIEEYICGPPVSDMSIFYDSEIAAVKSSLAVWRLLNLFVTRQGIVSPNLGLKHGPLVAVCGRRIILLPASGAPGRVFEVGFTVNMVTFSGDRKALAVSGTFKRESSTLVVNLQSDSIELRGRYSHASTIVRKVELNFDGSSMLVHYITKECTHYPPLVVSFDAWLDEMLSSLRDGDPPSESSGDIPTSQSPHPIQCHGHSVSILNHIDRTRGLELSTAMSHAREDRLLVDEDIFLVAEELSKLNGGQLLPTEDLPLFIKNMPQLCRGGHPLGEDLLWHNQMLYLSAPQGGPMVLDFSQHPAFLPGQTEETQEASPRLSMDDQGVEMPFSDDDYYEDEEESGDE